MITNEIIEKIQNGDKLLLEEVINNNLEFINSFTKEYYDTFSDYEDLVQEAKIGFIKSLYLYDLNEKFNIDKCKFWIYKHIQKYLLNNLDGFKDKYDKLYLCERAYQNCKKKLKHEPSIEEIRKYYSISKTLAYKILDILNDNNKNIIGDIYSKDLVEEKVFEKESQKLFRKKYISTNLTQLQKDIILLKYGFYNKSYTIKEISEMLNTKTQNIYQGHKTALKRLNKVIYK